MFDNMSQSVPMGEANGHLAQIVEAVEAGAEVEITRYGKPVAVIVRPSVLEDLRGARSAGFDEVYGVFIRSVDMQLGAIDLEMFHSIRERPAWTGSRR